MAKKVPDAGKRPDSVPPARIKLGDSLSARLAAVSGVPAAELKGLTVAEIAQKHPFVIDPAIFFFRRVCGKVVKTDPVTGEERPVPFATVQVEDTDCSFLGFFPVEGPFGWLFPFRCKREIIATAKTDACGEFCVWIPRWDIDWVLRFRRERICFPIIFRRPSLEDLIVDLFPPKRIPHPWPEPDPWPPEGPLPVDWHRQPGLLDRVRTSFGAAAAGRLARAASAVPFGASRTAQQAMLSAPAPLTQFAPPLPQELTMLRDAELPKGKQRAAAAEQARAAAAASVAKLVGLDPAGIRDLSLRRWVGPFLRCRDVLVARWVPLIDIPDITFRVLQDTNADGVEEVIYGESFFDVRWNAGPLAPVTIEAWPNAVAGPPCGPDQVPCGNVPAIVFAERLLLTDPLVFDATLGDATAGYGLRTNRPHPLGGFSDPPAATGRSPLRATFGLFGCKTTNAKATHYRLMYRYSADGGLTFSAPAPFMLALRLSRPTADFLAGEYYNALPDAQGWHPIQIPKGANPNDWHPANLLIDWPTGSFADGLYGVTLELGTGGAVTSSSSEVAFVIDNSAPTGPISVEWSFSQFGPFVPLANDCPIVPRGAVPKDVYFRVSLPAQAQHLRSAVLWANACGPQPFEFASGTGGQQAAPGSTEFRHWHTSPSNNTQTLVPIYRLPAAAQPGTYSFLGHVSGRAFSPTAANGGHLAVPEWQFDPDEVWISPWIAFTVADVDP